MLRWNANVSCVSQALQRPTCLRWWQSNTGTSFGNFCLATIFSPVIQLVHDHDAVQSVQLATCSDQVTQLVSEHNAVQLDSTTWKRCRTRGRLTRYVSLDDWSHRWIDFVQHYDCNVAKIRWDETVICMWLSTMLEAYIKLSCSHFDSSRIDINNAELSWEP